MQSPEKKESSPRLMLVDDKVAILDISSELLRRLGYAVQAYGGGPEALEAYAADPGRWSAILTDQNMPGLTGLELARKVRAAGGTLPIILVTGLGESVPTEKLEAAGVTTLLTKPFDLASLRKALDGVGGIAGD